jgi:pilus assembly protein Flp/PilA
MISTFVNQLYLGVQNLVGREDGQDLIEYALLAALIAVACVASLGSLATAIQGVFSTVSTDLA